MENVEQFLKVSSGSGYGSGRGSGDGYGDGYGSGDGYGDGYGSGDGCGCGSGCGSGDGYGCGSGCGSGDGYGYGYGYGSGGIEYFDGHKVHTIDGVNTVITSVRGNLAKGFTIKGDLTIEPCFVAKVNDCFAHGKTAREAYEDALSKYTSNLSEEERISMFLQCHNFTDTYPAKDLFEWHNRLTGSCKMGRLSFCERKGIDLSKDTFTVDEFITLTENEYGGSIIKKLKDYGNK